MVWTLHAFDVPLEKLATASIMNNDVVGTIFVMMMVYALGFALLHQILQTRCLVYRTLLSPSDQEEVLVNIIKTIYLGGICIPCFYLLLSICFEEQSSIAMTKKATRVCSLVLPIVVLLVMEVVIRFRHILKDRRILAYNLVFSGVTVLVAYTLSTTNLLTGATIIFYLTFGATIHLGLVLHKLSIRCASFVLRIGSLIWLISRFAQGTIVVMLLLHSASNTINIGVGIGVVVFMSILQLARIKTLLQLAREGDETNPSGASDEDSRGNKQHDDIECDIDQCSCQCHHLNVKRGCDDDDDQDSTTIIFSSSALATF